MCAVCVKATTRLLLVSDLDPQEDGCDWPAIMEEYVNDDDSIIVGLVGLDSGHNTVTPPNDGINGSFMADQGAGFTSEISGLSGDQESSVFNSARYGHGWLHTQPVDGADTSEHGWLYTPSPELPLCDFQGSATLVNGLVGQCFGTLILPFTLLTT